MEDINQYDEFAENFSGIQFKGNQVSREVLYKRLPKKMKGLKILDLGCGDGVDLVHFQKLGANCFGIDASEEIIAMAQKKVPKAILKAASFQNIPFSESYFDWIYSKYAIQTVDDVDIVFQEAHRVLKPKGNLLYVVVHPLRQFLEKKKGGKDYYKKEVVNSVLFGGEITVKEPVHTMGEYLNNFVLRNFDLIHYEEVFDPAAEQVGGQIYPGFMLIHATKK